MNKGYIFDTEKIFYKHESSRDDVYSMHIHTAYELLYFIGGEATCIIENRKYKLKAGDLILIRPLKYHYIDVEPMALYERYDILFKPDVHGIESALLIDEKTEVVNTSGNLIIDGIFKKLDVYHETCDGEVFEKLLSHLLSELFYNVLLFPGESASGCNAASPFISRAVDYINENLPSIGEIGEIADHLFVSESYLFRKFKEELHTTPKKYLLEKRLFLSKELISRGERPSEVCYKVGFKDYTTFYRNYTSLFKCSPTGRSGK